MSLHLKYTLDRLVADGETKTFRARENETGRIVFLHLFNPEGKALLGTLGSQVAKDPRLAPLIELGEFAGSPFAVTEPIEPFTSLRAWLISKGATLPPAQPDAFTQLFGEPMDSKAPAPKAPEVSDEFTRLFGSAPTAPVSAKVPGPGEFTLMFNSSATPEPKASSDTAEFARHFGAAPEKRAPAAQTDDFEKLFGSAPGQAPVRKENPLPPGASPDFDATLPTGKFAQFLSGPSGEAINIEEEQARAARKAAPESRPFQPPGEFTRMFGPQGGRAPGAKAPPPLPPSTIGPAPGASASGLFAVPSGPPPMPRAPGERPKTQAGPGEYTRLMEASKLDPNRVAPEPLPAPSKSKLGWIIGLSIGVPVLLLLAYLLVSALMRK